MPPNAGRSPLMEPPSQTPPSKQYSSICWLVGEGTVVQIPAVRLPSTSLPAHHSVPLTSTVMTGPGAPATSDQEAPLTRRSTGLLVGVAFKVREFPPT